MSGEYIDQDAEVQRNYEWMHLIKSDTVHCAGWNSSDS